MGEGAADAFGLESKTRPVVYRVTSLPKVFSYIYSVSHKTRMPLYVYVTIGVPVIKADEIGAFLFFYHKNSYSE